MRYFFEIRYRGDHYHGWQTQHNAVGVQSVVEKALSIMLRQPTHITGSGRTDTGVHCIQQFFHCDLPRIDPEKTKQKLNSFLPSDIAIRSITAVRDDAHARYDAMARTYFYRIVVTKDPMLVGLSLHYHKPLNLRRLKAAAGQLIGERNFKCFSKAKADTNGFLCNIKKANWKKSGDDFTFEVVANRFLRGMVRAMVGTMLDVGTGSTSLEEFKSILRSRDRRRAGANVPAGGLYLKSVKYPKSIFI